VISGRILCCGLLLALAGCDESTSTSDKELLGKSQVGELVRNTHNWQVTSREIRSKVKVAVEMSDEIRAEAANLAKLGFECDRTSSGYDYAVPLHCIYRGWIVHRPRGWIMAQPYTTVEAIGVDVRASDGRPAETDISDTITIVAKQ
jgi:hypothetical protein